MIHWKDDLWLFNQSEMNQLPDGMELETVNGEKVVKGQDRIDFDTRGGYLAYGVKDPENHALKDTFLMFMLAK